MPSFTFVSTANAFVLRGATPVFVDVRADTLNLDERLIEAAITPRTRAIVAGALRGRRLRDGRDRGDRRAARPAGRSRTPRRRICSHLPAGSRSAASAHLAALSFHETKNVHLRARAARCWSTTRAARARRDHLRRRAPTAAGSSAARSTSTPGWTSARPTCRARSSAAFLYAQLEAREAITRRAGASGSATTRRSRSSRRAAWSAGPSCPPTARTTPTCTTCCCEPPADRDAVIRHLRDAEVHAVFHYVPLHSSPAGRRSGAPPGELRHTHEVSERLVRLPLWAHMHDDDVSYR